MGLPSFSSLFSYPLHLRVHAVAPHGTIQNSQGVVLTGVQQLSSPEGCNTSKQPLFNGRNQVLDKAKLLNQTQDTTSLSCSRHVHLALREDYDGGHQQEEQKKD